MIDRGGTATAQQLREDTGTERLQYLTGSLSTQAARVLGARFRDGRAHRHFVAARAHPDVGPRGSVYDYHIDEELLPLFDEALTRLQR